MSLILKQEPANTISTPPVTWGCHQELRQAEEERTQH